MLRDVYLKDKHEVLQIIDGEGWKYQKYLITGLTKDGLRSLFVAVHIDEEIDLARSHISKNHQQIHLILASITFANIAHWMIRRVFSLPLYLRKRSCK
jgi:hypothetical protein